MPKYYTYKLPYNNLFDNNPNATTQFFLGASSPYSSFMNGLSFLFNNNKKDADYFIVPVSIKIISGGNRDLRPLLSLLTHYKEAPHKHIFFMVGDEHLPCSNEGIFFQTSARLNDNVECLHYSSPCNSFVSNNTKTYNISFMGCVNSTLRFRAVEAMKSINKHYVETTNTWFGSLSSQVRLTKELSWVYYLRHSKFILCPRGVGLNSIRFFEAMAHGCVPVLISDHTQLPLENFIPWRNCIVRVPENDVQNLAKYVSEFKNPEEAGQNNAMLWKKYFNNAAIKNFLNVRLSMPD